MNVKKTLKISAVVVLVLVAGLGARAYLKLKENGLIPRESYETVAPVIPEMQRPAVLVLNKTNGYIHKEGIPAADAMLQRIADEQGWDIFISNNGATHNVEELKKFDLVVWNNVSGDVLTEEQRVALQQWIQQGGGWVGLHASGGDFKYAWDWYVDTLIGAQFVGHTMEPQFQDADVLVVDNASELTSHLQSPWNVKAEEWYAFDASPRDKGYDILLTLDESSYITKGENWMGLNDRMEGEHPIAWQHQLGQGKVFYSAIGHQAATYSVPEYQELIRKAMVWAMSAAASE
ncbi:ThuA domain-containing protein [Pseudomaricurvus sp.]|uniref:ThuA domain-containing protein n=1 Tax=Pseudomaricurvus sp. TaxID=2004510 RepID=UPI003F6D2177